MVQIVADIGTNWMGSLDHAIDLMEQIHLAGVNFVKFQMWRASDLYTADHPHWSMIVQSELSENMATILKKEANRIGIRWFTSTFYPDPIQFLAEKLKVPFFKLSGGVTSMIGSKWSDIETTGILQDHKQLFTDMLTEMNYYTKIPIIASINCHNTTIKQMNHIKRELRKSLPESTIHYLITHSVYPPELSDLHWLAKINFEEQNGIPGCDIKWDGYSDHSLTYAASLYAVAQGAKFIEVHTGKENTLEWKKTPDACVSWGINAIRGLVHEIRLMERFMSIQHDNLEQVIQE